MVLILKKFSTKSAVSGAYAIAIIRCVASKCFQAKSAECTNQVNSCFVVMQKQALRVPFVWMYCTDICPQMP